MTRSEVLRALTELAKLLRLSLERPEFRQSAEWSEAASILLDQLDQILDSMERQSDVE